MADKLVKSPEHENLEKVLEVVKKQNPMMTSDAGTSNTVQVMGINVPADWHSQASNIQVGAALPPWLWQIIIQALQTVINNLFSPQPQPQPAPTPQPPQPVPTKQ